MTEERVASPLRLTRQVVGSAWKTALTIYYANSVPWRLLKAGGLFVFGFFLWAGSNVLLSYVDGVTLLRYTLSYGFVLVLYGPFHHLVVIPAYQRLRREGTHLTLGGHLHLPNLSLAVFLALVILLGTFPVGPMTIDFQSSVEGGAADVTPDLACVKDSRPDGATTVHCHLTDSRGVDRIVVRSGDETLAVDDEAPYEFTVRAEDLRTVAGSERFRVDLLAEDGSLVRRYTRTVSMIEEG